MDKAAKLRWRVLSSALIATITAIFYPVEDAMDPVARRAIDPKQLVSAGRALSLPTSGRPMWVASNEDPFAPRVWEAVPLAVQSVQVVPPAPVAPPVAAEPETPPLPYRFLGQMQDGDKHVLYLGHGEQVLLAQQGDVLESSYKVVAVSEGQIEFESLQSGARQTLPIPVQ